MAEKAEKIIDLRSDTVTRPSEEMYVSIKNASCQDAFLGDDPSTKELEKVCAKLFGFEDAIFVTSCTLANQLAIKTQTSSGDEIVTDYSYHINYYEAAAVSSLSGVHINTLKTADGIITCENLKNLLFSRNKSRFNSILKMLCLENTINYHSGKIFPFSKLKEVSKFAKSTGMLIHLDGARIFNAIAEEQNILPNAFSLVADSMSISFTKGLGAPFGSILMGTKSLIKKASIYNKWYGGGMHQSGLMAECALFAIKNKLSLIKKDNEKAKSLAKLIAPKIKILPVETNIIILDLSEIGISAEKFANTIRRKKILVYQWSEYKVRIVMHNDIAEKDITFIADEILKAFNKECVI